MKRIHNELVNGHIVTSDREDYLFRVSLKAIILNKNDEILVVKESGRDWWDLPGGGMDHGESTKGALARELKEEVSLTGDFDYKLFFAEDARYITNHSWYQLRLIFLVKPENDIFETGIDGDEIMFVDPELFKDSNITAERKIYEYSKLILEK